MIEVFHSLPNQINKSKGLESQANLSHNTKLQMENQNPTKYINLDLNDIDHVSSNVRSSNIDSMLYVLEDIEAVIKMIIKGRSPTVTHGSRTHLVALGWLFDRINLDSKIQIRYIDTKHQLADILTKGSFTRDEWNSLLLLFISHFSSTCCTKNFSSTSCSTMAKRIQEQKKEERVVSKSRPAAMNLSSSMATNSSAASSPIASESPGMPVASGKPDSRRIEPNSFDAASTSQGQF